MSFPATVSTGSSLRQTSAYSVASQQVSVLAARIESKKSELENLRQLRDLSNALAEQMQALEAKLDTLKEGTEAVACVLANWENILQVINMASIRAARLHVPGNERRGSTGNTDVVGNISLLATLVRIPASTPKNDPAT